MKKEELQSKIERLKLANLTENVHCFPAPKQTTKEVEVPNLKLLSEANGITILTDNLGKCFVVTKNKDIWNTPTIYLKELKQVVEI